MDWKGVVAELMGAGVSQAQIAQECGVAQSSVSDLHRGATKQPSFEFGNKLLGLHARSVGAAAHAASPARADSGPERREHEDQPVMAPSLVGHGGDQDERDPASHFGG